MKSYEFKILLIDDDEEDYILLRDFFDEIQFAKYNLLWKPSYKDGLEALIQEHFDACLLDYRLGEYTGLDLIQESNFLNNRCPIILLTGQGDFEIDMQAMNVGAADYLAKNKLTSDLLERSIRYSMKRSLDMQEIAESERSFKTLFNSTFEGVAVHEGGVVVDANKSLADMFGVDFKNIIGASLHEFIKKNYREQFIRELNSESSSAFECIASCKGKDIFIEIANREINFKDKAYSLVAIRDITERKQMEAQILQQDRLASLGLLASSLAHEIGNPLGVIRGRSDLAKKKAKGNQALEGDLDTITAQIDRISRLVHSLLHLARGKKSENIEKVSLNHVIENVIGLIKFELEKKNIKFEVDMPDYILVTAEASQLSQVFFNLIINAVHAIEEATEKGMLRDHKISVRAKTEDGFVKISVQDTGVGIPQENMTELFKPFFTTKGIGVGTGLGLVTSYKLIESWGGSIVASSPLGSGANFTVSLNSAQIV